jgi:hypothetical protein
MSDEGLAKTPDALKRRDGVVSLVDGGAMRVVRWNYARERFAMKLITKALGKVDLKKLAGGGIFQHLEELIDLLGDSMLELVKLSISPEDFAKWDELAPIDRLEVQLAVFEVNRLADYAKKVREVWSTYRPSAPAAGSSSR